MGGPSIHAETMNVPITGHSRHRQTSPVAATRFIPPKVKRGHRIEFTRNALALAVARTSTLLNAPRWMLDDIACTEALRLRWLLNSAPLFELSNEISCLADQERTAFAGRLGAGMADLTMNALGYIWRDNAASLPGSSAPRPDFVSDGGSAEGHGVVVVEAHGSFAAAVTAKMISREAKRKYLRQVKPYVAVNSCHGEIIHGYSIAFGARPGTNGAFLHVAETAQPTVASRSASPTAGAPGEGRPVSTSLALASWRANLILAGAPEISAWIDWVRNGGDPPRDEPVELARFSVGDRSFLVGSPSRPPYWPWLWWPYWFGPAIESRSAESLLGRLTKLIATTEPGRRPETLELPVHSCVGFGLTDDERPDATREPDDGLVLFADGLALLPEPHGIPRQERTVWHPREGFLP